MRTVVRSSSSKSLFSVKPDLMGKPEDTIFSALCTTYLECCQLLAALVGICDIRFISDEVSYTVVRNGSSFVVFIKLNGYTTVNDGKAVAFVIDQFAEDAVHVVPISVYSSLKANNIALDWGEYWSWDRCKGPGNGWG